MFLTKKQLEIIAQQIASISVKDSDFEETFAAKYGDSVAIIQDGVNKRIDLSELGMYFASVSGELIPDNEDITVRDGTLSFADRSDSHGKGYVILRRDKTFAEQVTQGNTIYEIRYDFDLDGGSVVIPAGCVLRFNGGSIRNGNLDFGGSKISSESTAFYNVITNNIGNKKICSYWYDWSTRANNASILQSIFDSIYANKGGVFVLYDLIHYNSTITIKSVSDNSYTGSCTKIIGFNTEETGLVHHGNANGIECVGYTALGSSAAASNIIIENTNITNETSDPETIVAAIKIAGNQRGAHFYLKNVSIRTTKTENNVGFLAETFWVYSFIDCFISSYLGVAINGGTSAYFNNVFLSCASEGLELSGVYCNIDNIFGDFATGTMFVFKYCTLNINSIAAESPGLSCFISVLDSYVNIRNAFAYRQTSDDSVVLNVSGSTLVIDYLRLPKHNITASSLGWLINQPYQSTVIINDLNIEGIPFKHYSEQSAGNSYVSVGSRSRTFTNPGIQIENSLAYYDWYVETPTQKVNQISTGYSSVISNSAGTSIEWQYGPSSGGLMLNSNATEIGTPIGWIKRADGLYKNSTYRPIPAVDVIDSPATLPESSYKGACVLYNGVPVWWNGTAWVDAAGTSIS